MDIPEGATLAHTSAVVPATDKPSLAFGLGVLFLVCAINGYGHWTLLEFVAIRVAELRMDRWVVGSTAILTQLFFLLQWFVGALGLLVMIRVWHGNTPRITLNRILALSGAALIPMLAMAILSVLTVFGALANTTGAGSQILQQPPLSTLSQILLALRTLGAVVAFGWLVVAIARRFDWPLRHAFLLVAIPQSLLFLLATCLRMLSRSVNG